MKEFIYALINPSLAGLVKIGRTDRNPEARAQELSGHTGVPTPFVLAYQRLVSDSHHAESWIHTFLGRKGYRLSDRREFFTAPLQEVIDAIRAYPEGASSLAGSIQSRETEPNLDTGDKFLDGITVKNVPIWQEVFDEAEAFDFGLDDHLEDPSEAFKLYKQAAILGSPIAFRSIGEMYSEGRGTTKSTEQALAYYKKGASLGDYLSYAKMAQLFIDEGHRDNEAKCWTRFIDGLGAILKTGKHFDPTSTEVFMAYLYLERMRPESGKLYGEETIFQIAPIVLERAKQMRMRKRAKGLDTGKIDNTIAWLSVRCR